MTLNSYFTLNSGWLFRVKFFHHPAVLTQAANCAATARYQGTFNLSSKCQIFNTKLTITMKSVIYHVNHIGLQ